MLRTRTINKIKHILRKHNLEQECPTQGIDTIKAKKWLAQVSLAAIDRMEMDQLLIGWKLWDEQIQEVEVEIVKRQAKSETAAILATIPGCAAYSSLALACRIDPVARFPRAGSLPNYWGLTPRCRNSGEATERLGSITKEGSAMARFILAPGGVPRLAARSLDEGVVRKNQATARGEDRPRGGHAAVGGDQ